MPNKKNTIEVGSLWQERAAKEKISIYIITEIIKHPWGESSVDLRPVEYLDNGLKINITFSNLRSQYRKIG